VNEKRPDRLGAFFSGLTPLFPTKFGADFASHSNSQKTISNLQNLLRLTDHQQRTVLLEQVSCH
jgi:hypothetical protein